MRIVASQLALLLMLCLSLLGCRKEDPNPELKDPIYKDLEARAKSYAAEYDAGKIQVKTLREDLAKVEARSIERKNVLKELSQAEAKLVGAEQLARYYKIRAERRRLMGRQAYREAFARGEDWPNPREYSDYLVNRRLHEINMNWNARVPKLQDRTPASIKALEAKKPVAAEPEAAAGPEEAH